MRTSGALAKNGTMSIFPTQASSFFNSLGLDVPLKRQSLRMNNHQGIVPDHGASAILTRSFAFSFFKAFTADSVLVIIGVVQRTAPQQSTYCEVIMSSSHHIPFPNTSHIISHVLTCQKFQVTAVHPAKTRMAMGDALLGGKLQRSRGWSSPASP